MNKWRIVTYAAIPACIGMAVYDLSGETLKALPLLLYGRKQLPGTVAVTNIVGGQHPLVIHFLTLSQRFVEAMQAKQTCKQQYISLLVSHPRMLIIANDLEVQSGTKMSQLDCSVNHVFVMFMCRNPRASSP